LLPARFSRRLRGRQRRRSLQRYDRRKRFVQSCDDDCSVRGRRADCVRPAMRPSIGSEVHFGLHRQQRRRFSPKTCRPVQCSKSAVLCRLSAITTTACRSGVCEDPGWNREGWGTFVDVRRSLSRKASADTTLCKNDPFEDGHARNAIDIAVAGCGGDTMDDHRLCDALPSRVRMKAAC
jgi:hypothetical protein